MKLNKYISLLALTLCGFLAACDSDDYVDPEISPAVYLEYQPTANANEITVNFTPSKSVGKYTYAIGSDSDKDAFLAGTLPGIRTGEGNEASTDTFTGLVQNEVYTIFAMATTDKGTAGPLAMIKVKTRGALPDVNATALFVAERSAAFTIKGHTNYYKYVFALGREGDKDAFERGVMDGIVERSEMSEYTATYFDLDMDSDYVFYLMAYDRLSNLPTETFEYPFRTAAKGTVPAVDIDVEHIDIYAGDYKIIPNSLCSKFGVSATLIGKYDATIDNETYKGNVMKLMDGWARTSSGYITMGYAVPTPYQFVTADLLLDNNDAFNQQIELYVLVYGAGEDPVNVQRFIVETPAYDDNAGESDATVTISDINDTGAFYQFEVNENTMGLFFETFDEEWYSALLQSDAYYDGYIENYLYEAGKWNYCHGVSRTNYPEATADPGRTYIVFYMTINYNGPYNGFGELRKAYYSTTGEPKE